MSSLVIDAMSPTPSSQGSEEMDEDKQRDVAHILLVELLAYQVAFPVKWIDTQQSLLSQDPSITRFIEFGASKVLGGLMRRTLESKYGSKELLQALAPDYELLTCEQNVDKIRYDYTQTEAEPQSETNIGTSLASSQDDVSVPNPAHVVALPAEQQQTAMVINDVPIPVSLIVRNLIAYKLKKNWSAITTDRSIKDLTGGRSTMQNELVSDLACEFGNLPDGLEDIALDQLSAEIQARHSGKLGKQSAGLVGKFISAKMPSGWNYNAVREYLHSRWGLGPLRQDAVLLTAVTSEPAARFPSPDAAKQFLQGLVSGYAAIEGISLEVVQVQGAEHRVQMALMDLGQVRDLEEQQKNLAAKIHQTLGKHLGHDTLEAQVAQHAHVSDQLQARLDLWNSEFGEDFELGIKPSFDAKKGRRFASCWNTARVELMRLFTDTQNGKRLEDNTKTIMHLANLADHALETIIKALIDLSDDESGEDGGFGPTGRSLLEAIKTSQPGKPVFRYIDAPKAPRTVVSSTGDIEIFEVAREQDGTALEYDFLVRKRLPSEANVEGISAIHIRRKAVEGWTTDDSLTTEYHSVISDAKTLGLSFAGKQVLVTGAGPGSIAIEVVKGLLRGGARVLCTTSRAPHASAKLFQDIFEENGSSGSELRLMPFNQASKQDCEALIEYIYSQKGLKQDIDAVFPFAAIPDHGKEIDGLGSKSELAHRLMMVNVMRLLGAIVHQKRNRNMDCRPTMVVLPLSSNHGTFGGDGLYPESKLGLESLFDRFASESWSEYLLVCGAVIGWTRGTGLMDGNGMVAEAIEKKGVFTFSTSEMALNLLALMSDPIQTASEAGPLWADLNGGLQLLPDLKRTVTQARAEIMELAAINRAVAEQDSFEAAFLVDEQSLGARKQEPKVVRCKSEIGYPRLPDYTRELEPLCHLRDMVDPSKVIVVVGLSELGPWGGARTRWEKEKGRGFTREGFIELAWMMKLIKHFDGEQSGTHYVGWVDAQTQAPVRDDEIGSIYGEKILSHTGIRMVEPGIHGGFDGDQKEYLQEVVVEEDLPAFDANKSAAEALKLRHGDKVRIWSTGDTDDLKVQLLQGATIMVPKAIPFNTLVAGQLPTGFDASIYGVPEEIIAQVDPVTLYALCCTAEALYSAGISDPYEIYQHMHISEIGLFIGTSLGGLTKTKQMYRDGHLDRLVQGDVIQETLFNIPSAWINMLLLGGAGPIKTLAGACATSIESLDAACESIMAGKTQMCFVGGVDDIIEEDAFGFSTMKATVDSRQQLEIGRLPREMSRPNSESRAGFVESHGCGVQLVCTAELALKMGLPIYAVIASSTMAADGTSRSVPAAGQGVLSFARETQEASQSPLLDIHHRRACMEAFLQSDMTDNDYFKSPSTTPISSAASTDSVVGLASGWSEKAQVKTSAGLAAAQSAGLDRKKLAQFIYGNNFRALDPNISPMRAALAVWGLGVDDIDMVSMHGTSTRANDKNEAHVIQQQMVHLGRTKGLPLPVVCQKSLTGHPKAPAAAWMLNGCLQAMNDSIIPGNGSLDSVDDELRQFEYLAFPTKSLQVREIRAFLLNSFGFGQKGGQVIGIAPKFLFATIDHTSFDCYVERVNKRKRLAKRAYIRAMATNTIVSVKGSGPYEKGAASATYLRPSSVLPMIRGD